MINVQFHDSPTEIDQQTLQLASKEAEKSFRKLLDKNVEGNEWLGWLDFLVDNSSEIDLSALQDTAKHLQSISDIVLCIGIGGSYLGTAATLTASSSRKENHQYPEIRFLGTHLGSKELKEVMDELSKKNPNGSKKRVSIIVISKSGSTMETGVVFRILRSWLKQHHPEGIQDRVVAITSHSSGSLRNLVDEAGYESFDVPSSIGGRFSVLSPVGLFPLAVAGIDVVSLLEGARQQANQIQQSPNNVLKLASLRKALMDQGFLIECLSTFDQECDGLIHWIQQLQGESEGKDGKGLFPAKAFYSRDLHSLGQWVQEGPRILFETMISVKTPSTDLIIPEDDQVDGFEDLANKPLSWINQSAKNGTIKAHTGGGVPIIEIEIQDTSEKCLGAFFAFYMVVVGVMGDMMGINTYNQPGVEAYKKEMLTILRG